MASGLKGPAYEQRLTAIVESWLTSSCPLKSSLDLSVNSFFREPLDVEYTSIHLK